MSSTIDTLTKTRKTAVQEAVEDLEIRSDITSLGGVNEAEGVEEKSNESITKSSFGLSWHPNRNRLYDELHTRPFPVISSSVRVSHFASLHGTEGKTEAYLHLVELCSRYGVNPPAEGINCYYQSFGAFEVRWEAHTEFCTYTVIRPVKSASPFDGNALSTLPEDWVSQIPGQVIAAVHVEMLNEQESIPPLDELHDYFEGHRLIGCIIDNNQARLWTAFRPHSDGFGRVLVYNRSLNACQAGRLLRRLLELEAYRSMMLLGLPVAQDLNGELTQLEQKLTDLTGEISDIQGVADEKRMLGQLSTLSARIEQIITSHSYRFSATRAYYELVVTRLKELREAEVSGLLTMTEFLTRRVTPAYRTCEATSSRMDDLSRRVDRASELLRTRIDVVIEQQNQYLLKSMDRRSKLQLHMQQTVEGLSVAAISYYLLSMLDLVLGSTHILSINLDHKMIIGLAAPFVLGMVWWSQKRLKNKIHSVNQTMKEKQRTTEEQKLVE
ncbi:DUF3422 domain-containing protein [Litoribacillus peritrichatus]|uniref:DUF3422 domain-containing protein n=1 Tax=Litoribacillus peritrichatus TaxID=718191 RepID=A0ABP7M205_9GAMM